MALFPKINLPQFTTTETHFDKISPAFDFETGEFVLDRAGRPIMTNPKETLENWCLKTCMTARNTRLCYSELIGVELDEVPRISTPAQAKSQIIRSITEAIMTHKQVAYCKNFSFSSSGDEVYCSFDVAFHFWGDSHLEVQL